MRRSPIGIPSSQPIEPRIVEMLPVRVAYIRVKGGGAQAVREAFNKLSRWAVFRGLPGTSVSVVVLWDEPLLTAGEDLVFDACLTIPEEAIIEDRVNTQVLPGGRHAVHHCDVAVSELNEVWTRFSIACLGMEGHQPDIRPRYTFIDRRASVGNGMTKPLQRLIADLYLPIRPLL